MTYEAEVIAHSRNAVTGNEIATIRVVMPRSVLAEIVTHRLLFIDDTMDATMVRQAYDLDLPHSTSRNTASSRARPIKRMLEAVLSNPFVPVFRKGRKGMTSGEQVATDVQAEAAAAWAEMMDACTKGVRKLDALDIEKGQANRPLEWFSWVEMLITATEWNNFFLLRDHEGAQGEMRETAKVIRAALQYSIPNMLQPGEWHLPYIDPLKWLIYDPMQNARQSASRCAIISYRSLATGEMSTLDEDMARYIKLMGGNPKHLSPAEHPCRAEPVAERYGNFVGFKSLRKIEFAAEESGGDVRT